MSSPFSALLCVLSVSAVPFTSLCGCSRSHGPSVANGGFEDGLSGWTVEGGVAVVADAHSGKSAAGGDADAQGWALEQSKLGTSKNGSYRVDAWLRAEGDAVVALWTDEHGKNEKRRVAVWD